MPDITNLSPEDLQAIKAAFVEQKERVRFYWESTTELAQALKSGEVTVAACWNETAASPSGEGVPIRMARPKEGTITWVCDLVHVASGGGDEQMTYDVIDAFLAKE